MKRRVKAVLGLWAVGVASGLCAGERPARAQTAGDKAAAEAIFDDAKKLYGEKKFAEACARFDASERLDPGVGTLLYLGDCYENLGRLASAWATFREAASLAQVAAQADRERVARERAARLEPRLYRLTVTVAAGAPGLKVTRGDVEVRSETFGTGLPVDPGTYVIKATATGKKPWSIQVQIPLGAGEQAVAVPALEDDPAAALPIVAPPPLVPEAPRVALPPVPVEAPEVPGRRQRISAIVVGSVGVLALGIGAGLAGVAASDNPHAKKSCPGGAPCSNKTGVDLSNTAGGIADGATGLLIIGGVVVAAGVVMFATAPNAKAAKPSAWLAPTFGPGSAGLALGGVLR